LTQTVRQQGLKPVNTELLDLATRPLSQKKTPKMTKTETQWLHHISIYIVLVVIFHVNLG